MWQPGSSRGRSGGGGGSLGMARAVMVLARWAALLMLLTLVGVASLTELSATHLQQHKSGRGVAGALPAVLTQGSDLKLLVSSSSSEASSTQQQQQLHLGGQGRVNVHQHHHHLHADGGGVGIADRVRHHWQEFKSRAVQDRRSAVELQESAEDQQHQGQDSAEDDQGVPVMMIPLIHRDAPGSPLRTEHASRADEVRALLARDALRLASSFPPSHGTTTRRRTQEEQTTTTASSQQQRTPGTLKAPLYSGASLATGSYLVDINLGTPPRKYTLIADTGSDLVWTQCAPCADATATTAGCYPQLHPLYSPANSSTFAAVPCAAAACGQVPAPFPLPECGPAAPDCLYRYQYAGGAAFTEGVLGTETVTARPVVGAPAKLPGIVFGCGNAGNAGAAFGRADGVLGLGRGPLSFPSQLRASSSLPSASSKFAYCILDFSKPTTTTSLLLLGPAADTLLAARADVGPSSPSAIQYTALVAPLPAAANPSLYYVRPAGVAVAGAPVPGLTKPRLWLPDSRTGGGGTVFDSGVTLTYLVPGIYRPVLAAFQAHLLSTLRLPRAPPLDAALTLCVDVTGVKQKQLDATLPRLKIWFADGAVFEPPASNVFVNVGNGVRCLAIAEAASPGASNVLGNLVQQNFLVVYDSNQGRIGFAPSDCSF